MSAFGKLPDAAPPAFVDVPPQCFREDWGPRPSDTVRVGLRHVAAGTEETARGEAAKYAVEMHKDAPDLQVDAYQDALMRWIVAKATCQPSDVSRPFWKMAEDTVREALTSAGVRLIWDRYEKMLVETSPLDPELADEDVGELIVLLETGALKNMATSQATRARRLLRFVLNDLRLVV